MKALEKDRNRRYATPYAMAQDLSNYLAGNEVSACPPSTSYRVRKFARRNRVTLLTTVLVFSSLVLGLVGTTWQAFRAGRAEAEAQAKREVADTLRRKAEDSERKAQRQATRAKAISSYLRNDLLGLAGSTTLLDYGVRNDPDMKLRTLLERAKSRLDERFADNPADKMQIQSLLISSFSSIGE